MTWSSVTLVLGGARSGKSAYAESLFPEGGAYLATAGIGDGEMAERIAKHQARRGGHWRTVEAPLDLAQALDAQPGAALVDCLTLWLSNLMFAERDIDGATAELEAALLRHLGPVALVANEVGLGIVPDNALARAFRDRAGLLNQRLAAKAGRVVLVAAGLPLVLKESS
jgi:adenosylcobinamide kinase/adenosylcobinamide-phosphate guanylyltransferase